MWNLPLKGLSPLHPAQIHLLVGGAGHVKQTSFDDPRWGGVQCLKRMGVGERWLALKTVLCEVTSPTHATPDCAWREATLDRILNEISGEKFSPQRALVGISPEEKNPSALLRDMFLWDLDFYMEPVEDMHPEKNEQFKERMGIASTYFTEAGPPGSASEEVNAKPWLSCLRITKNEATLKGGEFEQMATILKEGGAVRLSGLERYKIDTGKFGVTCYPLPEDPLKGKLLWKGVLWDGMPMDTFEECADLEQHANLRRLLKNN